MVEQLVEQILHFKRKGLVFIGGDFNLLRTDPSMKRIADAMSHKLVQGAPKRHRSSPYLSDNVITRPKTKRAIDHILWSGARKGAKCSAARYDNAIQDLKTDHYGLGAEFRVKADWNRLGDKPAKYQRQQPRHQPYCLTSVRYGAMQVRCPRIKRVSRRTW